MERKKEKEREKGRERERERERETSVLCLFLLSLIGTVRDPMALHKEEKVTNIWTEEEKRIFREK